MRTGNRYAQLALAVTGLAWHGAIAQTPAVAKGGILNAASYVYEGLPNGDIAQGSLFKIYLATPIPALPVQFLGLPLQTSTNGISATVTSGATTTPVLIFSTEPNSLGALIPSSTPVGPATVTVTYNGKTSDPVSFNVVAHSFGWFTTNSAGSGTGIFTNVNYQIFTQSAAANPGETVVGWGTGLGPVTGDESAGALPGQLNIPTLTLWVGGQQVTPSYYGRGCCTGEDQINFVLPQNVAIGCAVPVVVQIGNVVSNSATLPIAASGRICSDPLGYNSTETALLNSKGGFTSGSVGLTASHLTVNLGGGLMADQFTNTASASFTQATTTSIISNVGFQQPSPGNCVVYNLNSSNPGATTLTYLDAGAQINLTGPKGNAVLTKNASGAYSASLSETYLAPGTYTADNGTGGKDIGPFKTTITINSPLTWTNESSISVINRSQGVTLTWTGGDPGSYVFIQGIDAIKSPLTVTSQFLCIAPIGPGQFTVPAKVLLALPPSDPAGTSFLTLGSYTLGSPISATGLDYGIFNASSAIGEGVKYQ